MAEVRPGELTPGSRAPMTRGSVQQMPTAELAAEAARRAADIARKEVELAKADLKADLKAEMKMGIWMGTGAVLALTALAIFFVALVFVLVNVGVANWLAAVLVGAGLVLVAALAALIGWDKRVRTPLAATRRSLKENVEWSKDVI